MKGVVGPGITPVSQRGPREHVMVGRGCDFERRELAGDQTGERCWCLSAAVCYPSSQGSVGLQLGGRFNAILNQWHGAVAIRSVYRDG